MELHFSEKNSTYFLKILRTDPYSKIQMQFWKPYYATVPKNTSLLRTNLTTLWVRKCYLP